MQVNTRIKRSMHLTTMEKVSLSIILALFFILATAHLFLSLDPVPTPLNSIKESRLALQAQEGYRYATSEEGSGYSLRFLGYFSGGRLVGEIEEYELHIYREKEDLYVKREGGEWVKAEEYGLERLSCFLVSPTEILEQVEQVENRGDARFLDDGKVVHVPFTSGSKALLYTLFPGISGNSIKDFDIFIRLTEGGDLEKIDMSLKLNPPDDSKDTINRTIVLKEGGHVSEIAYPDVSK